MGSTPQNIPFVPDNWMSYGAVNLPNYLQSLPLKRLVIRQISNILHITISHHSILGFEIITFRFFFFFQIDMHCNLFNQLI